MAKPLLLIGVHSDELAFGDRVAARLAGELDVLRVDRGLDDAKPTPHELVRYRLRHGELYRQVLQQVGRRAGPVIDLHCGLNEPARCAEIYGHDERFLDRIAHALATGALGSGPDDVRLVRIVAHEAEGAVYATGSDRQRPVVRTWIPEEVWHNPHVLYAGIEVFLPLPGPGSPADHAFAASLVRLVAANAMLERVGAALR